MTTNSVWPEDGQDLGDVFDPKKKTGCNCPTRIRVVADKASAERVRAGYCIECGGLLPITDAPLHIVVVTDPTEEHDLDSR